MKKPVKAFLFLSVLGTAGTAYSQKSGTGYLYPVIWDWMKGKSDSAYVFTEQSHPVLIRHLENAYQVRRAREFWYQKNMDSFKTGRSNWLPVSDFLGRFQTVRGICRAGTDMVEQALGGFTVHIRPVSRDSIKFIVFDLKSRWSLFFHLPFVSNRLYDRSRSRQKLMTNMSWTFEWTEPVRQGFFHQREWNLTLFPGRAYSGHNF